MYMYDSGGWGFKNNGIWDLDSFAQVPFRSRFWQNDNVFLNSFSLNALAVQCRSSQPNNIQQPERIMGNSIKSITDLEKRNVSKPKNLWGGWHDGVDFWAPLNETCAKCRSSSISKQTRRKNTLPKRKSILPRDFIWCWFPLTLWLEFSYWLIPRCSCAFCCIVLYPKFYPLEWTSLIPDVGVGTFNNKETRKPQSSIVCEYFMRNRHALKVET